MQEDSARAASYAAMILVHGGGWSRGCKHNLQREASVAAGTNTTSDVSLSEHFLVFNINYRMACTATGTMMTLATETNGDEDSSTDVCGAYFTSDPSLYDDVNMSPGIHDVEAAIHWVKNHADEYCPDNSGCFNDNIELVGNSSGGNLVYMAVGRMGVGNDNQVQAVGAWSGPLDLFYLTSTSHWPCSSNEIDSTKVNTCKSATMNYLGCGTYPDSPSCDGNLQDASPAYTLFDNALPPAFFASGTPRVTNKPEGSKLEVVTVNGAVDFQSWLHDVHGWSGVGDAAPGVYRFCTVVDGNDQVVDVHAKTYTHLTASNPDGYFCHDEGTAGGTVFENMVAWLSNAVDTP